MCQSPQYQVPSPGGGGRKTLPYPPVLTLFLFLFWGPSPRMQCYGADTPLDINEYSLTLWVNHGKLHVIPTSNPLVIVLTSKMDV